MDDKRYACERGLTERECPMSHYLKSIGVTLLFLRTDSYAYMTLTCTQRNDPALSSVKLSCKIIRPHIVDHLYCLLSQTYYPCCYTCMMKMTGIYVQFYI